ncbi:MAG: methionyl-tRNA formyltransferase [Cyanobacteria bacterium]|nr:methionyl-tRNA formyltransferase [Cyanobacteriota bacterium]
MKVLFLGTPEFAVPTLKALIEADDFEVVGCVCQPDRPKGRGNKVQAPPVKQLAVEHNIPVLQPERLSRSPEIVEAMRNLNPDVLVMVAFGQILKKAVLELAPHGVINLHGSVLPQYRGAAPINWAIINGETKTGITTMKTDAGVDTGDMLMIAQVDIDDEMTAEDLAHVLSNVGAPLILDTLRAIRDNTITPQRQDDALSTYAPILSRETGTVDWEKSARAIHDLVRGLQPWPGAYTIFRDAHLKLHKTRLVKDADLESAGSQSLPSGTVLLKSQRLFVACGAQGTERLELLEVQPESKAKQIAHAWANGVRLADGERLRTPALERSV